MIFDFRLRPPYKGFQNLSIFNPVCNAVAPHDVNAWRSESAHQKSMDLFFKEMDEAGIGSGVVMGRAAGNWASVVSNEDVHDLCRHYPDKFYPFGGVDVSSGILPALEEVRKCHKLGFRGIAVSRHMHCRAVSGWSGSVVFTLSFISLSFINTFISIRGYYEKTFSCIAGIRHDDVCRTPSAGCRKNVKSRACGLPRNSTVQSMGRCQKVH